jgi:antirestriction protein ArdC
MLNRIKKGAAFGSEEYSKEELIAEIGASALVSLCGLETESSFRNNAAYINGWRDAISKDNKLIVAATGKAEKAVNRILNPVTL